MKLSFLHKTGISALLLAGGCFSAQAQTKMSTGVRLGGNLTKFSYSGVDQGLDGTNNITGLQVGGTLNFDFGTVAFQPSLIFTQKGSELHSSQRLDDRGYKTTVSAVVKPSVNFLELPLNVVYTQGGDHGFQLFAGPYVALGVGGGGTYKVDINTNDPSFTDFNGSYPGSLKVEFGDRQNANSNLNNGPSTGTLAAPSLTLTVKRLDFGLNAGVGYRIGPVQAQLGYGLGLVNFVPKDTNGNDTGSKGYHRSLQLNATYFFGSK